MQEKMENAPGCVLHKGGAHSLFNHLWDPALQHRCYTVKHESLAGPVSFLSQSVAEENKLRLRLKSKIISKEMLCEMQS